MANLDQNLLKEIGADGLSEDAQEQILGQFYQMLNQRVGIALSEAMTDEQFDGFQAARESGGEEKAFEWLNDNVPEYPVIFNKEAEELTQEIKLTVQAMDSDD
jgi:hypothetical protein